MIVIKEFAYKLGKEVRCVEEIAAECSKEEIKHMYQIGLNKVPTDNECMLQEMIQDVCKQITQKPDCILIAHPLPFIREDGQDMELCWSNVPLYYLSGMPCAIMHKAVEVASSFIEKGLYHSVLVIGADKAYSDQERIFFGTIMGDGVIALLLEEGIGTHQILSSYINTTILASDGENSNASDIAAFRRVNVSLMRQAMQKCLEKSSLKNVDYYITHTSNREFWNSVAALTKIPREIFLDFNIQNTGHMNSHDSFYHYCYYCEKNMILPGQTVMLINPGFGGTQGCTLLRR